jgi:hypothetical protein
MLRALYRRVCLRYLASAFGCRCFVGRPACRGPGACSTGASLVCVHDTSDLAGDRSFNPLFVIVGGLYLVTAPRESNQER